MPIYSLRLFNIVDGKSIILANAQDITSFPLMTRLTNSSTELLVFLSRTFVDNTIIGNRQECIEGDYMGWVHHDINGMVGVIICDNKYKRRIAFGLLSKAMEIFKSDDKNWDWSTLDIDKNPNELDNTLQELIKQYQNPSNTDNILKITKDLEDTRITLHDSIDKMLERGDNINNLVEKSNDLSLQSKKFYKKTKKLNSWCNSCTIM